MHKQAAPGERSPGDLLHGQSHPNLAAVLPGRGDGERVRLVPEPADGETLAQYLARVPRLPVRQALALVLQLLSGLAALHAQGHAHGELGPDCLRLGRTGQLKVGGLEDGTPVTARGPYRAPEQQRGQPGDARSDVYSAAVLAHLLLAGAMPPAGGVGAGGLHALRSELPASLDAVFARALAKEPHARFQDAGAFSTALQAVLAPSLGLGPGPTPPPPVAPRPEPLRPPAGLANARIDALGARVQRVEFCLAAACLITLGWIASAFTGVAPIEPARQLVERGSVRVDSSPGRRWEGVLEAPVLRLPAASQPTPAFAAEPPIASPPPAQNPVSQPPPEPQLQLQLQPQPQAQPLPAARPLDAEPPKPRPVKAREPETVRVEHVARRASASRSRPEPTSQRGKRPVPGPSPQAACGPDTGFGHELCTVFLCATREYRHHRVCVTMHTQQQRARDRAAITVGGP
ncbi:serine/threonine protein kinase [Ramlibacter rhizophilus]|nr:hypothetical protein [Ramlibacter rhizophilus]